MKRKTYEVTITRIYGLYHSTKPPRSFVKSFHSLSELAKYLYDGRYKLVARALYDVLSKDEFKIFLKKYHALQRQDYQKRIDRIKQLQLEAMKHYKPKPFEIEVLDYGN